MATFTLAFAVLDVRALGALASGDFSTGLVWFVLPLSVVFAIWVWPRARSALRNVFNALPVLLLDRDGVECAWGRVGWRDVDSVGLVPHEKDRTEVVFTLLPRTAWQLAAARYGDYTLKGRNDGQLRISCLKPKAVLEAVAALREPFVNESTEHLELTPNTAIGKRSPRTGTSWRSRVALVLGITATVVAAFLIVRATTSKDHPQVAIVPPQRPAGRVGGGQTPEEAIRLVDRDLSQKQFGLMWATLDPSVRHAVARAAFVDCWASLPSLAHGGLKVQSIKFLGVENAPAPRDLAGIQTKSLTRQEKGVEGGHSYDTKYTRDIVLANGRWYYVLPSDLRAPLERGSCPHGGGLVIQKAGPPTLATGPPKPGEIVLVGRATPRIYGPYSFPPGGFVVRFQEFDPTRPGVEPSADGSRFMVALLARDRVPSGKPSRVILNTTAPIGATRATARAKRYVYVSYSGKYAYVLRLTP